MKIAQATVAPGEMTAKGVHTFVVCDGRSKKAQKLSLSIEEVTVERTKAMLLAQDEVLPMEMEMVKYRIALSEKWSAELEAQLDSLTSLRNKVASKWDSVIRSIGNEASELIAELNERFQKREILVENITTTVGRAALASRLSGSSTYTGMVNYTALGTDSTAAAIGDTTLGTEVYRKALSSGASVSNIAYLETFFNATETSGTYQEYGMFMDGTSTADTGQMVNRFTQALAKSTSETLNVKSVITLNDA